MRYHASLHKQRCRCRKLWFVCQWRLRSTWCEFEVIMRATTIVSTTSIITTNAWVMLVIGFNSCIDLIVSATYAINVVVVIVIIKIIYTAFFNTYSSFYIFICCTCLESRVSCSISFITIRSINNMNIEVWATGSCTKRTTGKEKISMTKWKATRTLQ